MDMSGHQMSASFCWASSFKMHATLVDQLHEANSVVIEKGALRTRIYLKSSQPSRRGTKRSAVSDLSSWY